MNLVRAVFRRARRHFVGIRQRIGFAKDWSRFKQMSAESPNGCRFTLDWKGRRPCLTDGDTYTNFDTHYVYHTAWAARIVSSLRPSKHVDVSSSLYFCSLVSAFVPVDFYDFRPAPLILAGLSSKAGDLTNLKIESGSLSSLSCMHVVEHIGLGRYGDPLDPDGDVRAAGELARVLAPAGSLLFVVPMAEKAYIAFNAHRVYSYKEVLALFPGMELASFALIPDNALEVGMIVSATEDHLAGQIYSCGCFHFRKR